MNKVTKDFFGKTKNGENISIYTLSNNSNTYIGIIDFGATIVFLKTPDRNGNLVDIVLGFDTLEGYEEQEKYLGAIIGRHANRIEKGTFKLNDKHYTLYCNDGNNHLHGGKIGFDKKIWNSEIKEDKLCLSYLSKDGEEGYPGNLNITVTYSLSQDNTLTIDYSAVSDKDTVCNVTNHSYFNLAGHNSGLITNQKIQIFADHYTLANNESLPNGTIAPVMDTPLDLQKLTVIGENIDDDFEQIQFTKGYDHNWVISQYDGTLKKAAFAQDDTTGITLTTSTTLPGIQFYTGNFLDGVGKGKQNTNYFNRCGFCLETQYFPNAMKHDNFLKPILKKDEVYHSVTTYQLGNQF